MLKRFQSPIYCVWGNLNQLVVFTSMPALVAQRIEHLTTDQKVRGSNPFKRTKQNPTSEQHLSLIVAPLCFKNLTSVSDLVSNELPNSSKFNSILQPGLCNEYKPRLLEEFQNMLIIVYQRNSFSNSLILDKSSQDLILRGYSLGTQISIFSSRGFLSTINVSLKSESAPKGKENSLYKRGRYAPHSCDCNRSIHKTNIQRNNDWRF